MESCDISKLSRYITFWMQIICMVGYGINHYQKEIDELDLNLICENNLYGYMWEFDLKYPDKLHELDNDYALAQVVVCCESIVAILQIIKSSTVFFIGNWLVFIKFWNSNNLIGWRNTLVLTMIKERILSIALKIFLS